MKLNTTLYLLITGFVFSIVVFGGSIFFTYKTEENLFTDFNTVEETHGIMNDLKKVANVLDNLENSYKSFRSSKDEEFLSMFNSDEKLLLYEIDKLHKHVKSHSEDDTRLIQLQKLVDERIKLGRLRVHYIKSDSLNLFNSKLIDQESKLKIKIHAIINDIIAQKQKLLDDQHIGVISRFNQTHLTIQIVGISAALLTILILCFFWQYNKTHSKIENDLIELNDNKNKFFSIISHDLRGPVKNIVLMAQLLYQTDNKTIDPEKIARMIESSSKNLSALLDNLLKWSRLQMNNIEFIPETIDLRKVADDVISNMAVHSNQKSITVSNLIAPHTNVFADQNMIATVIRNLISNALKFTNKGGRIELLADRNHDYVELTISDNGVGMPTEIAKKIFSIDFKHTTKGTNKEEGTGLGLKLCKEFVEKNSGKIWIESEIGVGSKFIFSIPASNFVHAGHP